MKYKTCILLVFSYSIFKAILADVITSLSDRPIKNAIIEDIIFYQLYQLYKHLHLLMYFSASRRCWNDDDDDHSRLQEGGVGVKNVSVNPRSTRQVLFT